MGRRRGAGGGGQDEEGGERIMDGWVIGVFESSVVHFGKKFENGMMGCYLFILISGFWCDG